MIVSPGFRGQYLHLEKGRYNGKEPRYGGVRRCAFFAWVSRFAIANEGRPTPDVGEYHQCYSYYISYLSLGIYSIFSGVDLGVESGGCSGKVGIGVGAKFPERVLQVYRQRFDDTESQLLLNVFAWGGGRVRVAKECSLP